MSSNDKKYNVKLIVNGTIGCKSITKVIFPTVLVNKEYIKLNVENPNINWKLTTVKDIFYITEVKNEEGIWKTQCINKIK